MKKFLKENGLFLLLVFTILFINFHFPKYYIRTGSMEPVLHVGAVVFVSPDIMPKENDIAAYVNGNNIIIHRVKEITDEGYIFKGDANAIEDAYTVPEDEIKGTVIVKINMIAPIVRAILHLPSA